METQSSLLRPAFPSVLPEGMCYNEEGLSRIEYYALKLLAARFAYGSTNWEDDIEYCISAAIQLNKRLIEVQVKLNNR